MTAKKDLLEAHRRYKDDVAPALESITGETMRKDGPPNALAWVATVGLSFAICLGLLLLVAGG